VIGVRRSAPLTPTTPDPSKKRGQRHVTVKLATYDVNLICCTRWRKSDIDRADAAGRIIAAMDADIVVIDEAFRAVADDMAGGDGAKGARKSAQSSGVRTRSGR
jgi:hypothetical protein